MIAIDFETEEIVKRSPIPPKPVSVSIKKDNNKSIFYSWGHPIGNNCSVEKITSILRELFAGNNPLLFHNAKFDIAVAVKWFGCQFPKNYHDTLFLAYLYDPRMRSLELKVLANDFLYIPPDEQLDLKNWIFENIKGSKRTKKNWGKYICMAPANLVGKYAQGDTDRTKALFDYFYPEIVNYEMVEAYQRELKLLPVIMDMESRGIPISDTIHNELAKRESQLKKIEKSIYRKIGDLDSWDSRYIYRGMYNAGLVDEEYLVYTDTGKISTARENLATYCTDKKLTNNLEMRSRLVKVIGTYLKPWSEAQSLYGRYYPYFNQTRNDYGGGTRTGRLSSDFQQVPKEPDDNVDISYLRNFVIAESGETLISRDWSQQELRILAHYAEGKLLEAYIDNPTMDIHDWVRDLIINVIGLKLDRKSVKTINFLQVYGGGVPALSNKLKCSLDEAYTMLKAHKKALPEIGNLSNKIERQVKSGILLRTWGGRIYDVERGYSKRGVLEDLFYKLLNVFIQGSAADQAKQAMINYYYSSSRKGRLMLQVHDEFIISVIKKYVMREMALVRGIMNNPHGWDVPMLSDGKTGKSWGESVEYVDNR